MVDLEGNVGETKSRYHDHMNEICAMTRCDVYDEGLTTWMSLVVGAGHVRDLPFVPYLGRPAQALP